MILVQLEPIDPADLLNRIAADMRGGGAIVSFTGIVRPSDGEVAVTQLELQAYPGFTEKMIASIIDETRDKFDLEGALVAHRYGRMAALEPVIFVATAAPHRRAAFDAADYLMDQLKTRAPFWKKEHGPAGSRWIEPRQQDHDDVARWAR